MSTEQKGYIIPANPLPDGLRCLRVYIPDDDIYQYAFAGAYHFFSKWVAWERDGTGRAAMAAAAWRSAWYYTMENAWENCGDTEMDNECCERIINLLEDLNNMNITQNNNCGSGSGDGCSPVIININNPPGSQCLPVPPPGAETPPDVIVPPGGSPPPIFDDDPNWPSPGDYNAARCRIANYGWSTFLTWIDRMIALDNLLFSISTWIMVISQAIAGLLTGRITFAQMIAIAQALLNMQSWYGQVMSTVRQWWIDNQQEIVCAAYNAVSSNALAAYIVDWIADGIVELLDSETWWVAGVEQAVRDLLARLFPPTPFSIFLNFAVPVGYAGVIDCSTCGGGEPPELPPVPEGWVLWPAPLEAITAVPNNDTAFLSFSGNGVFGHAPATANNYHEVTGQVDISDVVANAGGVSAHGMIVRLTSYAHEAQFNNDGVLLSGNTGGTVLFPAAAILDNWRVYWDNLEQVPLADFLALFDTEDSYEYGNGAMVDVQASFRSQTYGIQNPASMTFEMFYIIKLA